MTLLFLISVFLIIQGIAYQMGWETPAGAMLGTLTPITGTSCRKGSAGIAEAYFIDYNEIDHSTGVTWDADEQASAIPLVTSQTWTKYTFEKGTAFFNQEKQAPGSNINFVQTISMVFPNNDADTRLSLKNMDQCCELVGFIVDNQGKSRLAGIRPAADGAGTASISLGMRTGEGSYNTGADPQSESNERIVTLTCNSPVEAPYTSVLTSSLALTP